MNIALIFQSWHLRFNTCLIDEVPDFWEIKKKSHEICILQCLQHEILQFYTFGSVVKSHFWQL